MTLKQKQDLFIQGIIDTRYGVDDSETPTGEILKIHLLTEVLLDHLIVGVFGQDHGHAILGLELRYSQKLDLCSGCKLEGGRDWNSPEKVDTARLVRLILV